MKSSERALQMWQILISAAHNRQTLTYGQMSELVDLGPASTGGVVVSQHLGLLLYYCKLNNLPPITVLVVNKNTGRPGEGLTTLEELNQDRERVFNHEWFKLRPLRIEDLEAAKELWS